MAAEAPTNLLAENVVSLGTKNGMEMAILARSEKTLGTIIFKSDSADLIDGVQIGPLAVYPDDRGFFMEIGLLDTGLSAKMTPEGSRQIQVFFTLTYPGTIKAIHYHSEQTDSLDPRIRHAPGISI
jgi:hypothetical protein